MTRDKQKFVEKLRDNTSYSDIRIVCRCITTGGAVISILSSFFFMFRLVDYITTKYLEIIGFTDSNHLEHITYSFFLLFLLSAVIIYFILIIFCTVIFIQLWSVIFKAAVLVIDIADATLQSAYDLGKAIAIYNNSTNSQSTPTMTDEPIPPMVGPSEDGPFEIEREFKRAKRAKRSKDA